MPAPFATRPARDILAGLVEAWDDADTLARGTLAARNAPRALPVRLRADGGPLHDGVHPDANGAAERNGWLFIVVLAIAALIGVVLAIKGGGA